MHVNGVIEIIPWGTAKQNKKKHAYKEFTCLICFRSTQEMAKHSHSEMEESVSVIFSKN